MSCSLRRGSKTTWTLIAIWNTVWWSELLNREDCRIEVRLTFGTALSWGNKITDIFGKTSPIYLNLVSSIDKTSNILININRIDFGAW